MKVHVVDIQVQCIRSATLREPCNNQRPRCDIAWLHATNHIYHGFPSETVKQSHASIV
jgi:hypothetical protein